MEFLLPFPLTLRCTHISVHVDLYQIILQLYVLKISNISRIICDYFYGRVKTYINGCIFSDDNPKIHPLMYIFQYTSTGVFSKYTRCGILKNMLQYTTTGVFSNLKIHPLGYKKTKQLVYHNGCIFRIVMKVLFLRVSATVTSQMRHFPKELLFLRVYATVASQMRHLPIFTSS